MDENTGCGTSKIEIQQVIQLLRAQKSGLLFARRCLITLTLHLLVDMALPLHDYQPGSHTVFVDGQLTRLLILATEGGWTC
jgi:hypothetical protein